jgi:hypothetical protein
MRWGHWFQFFLANISKDRVEHWTLWILTIGVFVAVSLNVAKWIVRDYRDLQREIHRPTATETRSGGSSE